MRYSLHFGNDVDASSGHYDVLYKAEDIPPQHHAISNIAIPTYLQYASHPHQEPVYDLGVPDFMMNIPGMSFANPHQAWMSNSSYAGSDFFSTPTPAQPCAQPVSTPVASIPQPQIQPQAVYVSATPSHHHLVAPPLQMPQEMAIRPASHAGLAHASFQHQVSAGPFRPSVWELEPDFVQATSHVPFQTSIFRK